MASTMPTAAPAVANAEPEYGCEHLRTLLEDDSAAAGQFVDRFAKFHRAEPWNSEDGRKAASVGSASSSSSTRPLASLKPLYHCLQCSMLGLRAARLAHRKETGHIFFADCRSRSIFCHKCDDFVYDAEVERSLGTDPASVAERLTVKRKFDEAEEGEGDSTYIASNTNKKICGRDGVRGLFNLGQTCYMNVILQTLFHEPVLTAYFLGNGHPTSDCQKVNCFGCSLAEAFAEFNNEEKEDGFGALNLLLALWQSSSELSGYQQQDAHEFYQHLVDRLHLSANETGGHSSKCRCFFHTAFYGKLQSTVTCGKCGNASHTEDPILDVSLDLQIQKKRALDEKANSPLSIQDCLQGYITPEQLELGEYDCAKCGSNQRATKELKLKKLPVVLCMQLKRFERIKSVSEKVDTKVSFPLSINMAPYTTKPDCQQRSQFQYDLLSVVVHIGDLDSGHYLAYCRHGEQWFKFNDDRVTCATEADVLGADAYLLFYTLHSYSISE